MMNQNLRNWMVEIFRYIFGYLLGAGAATTLLVFYILTKLEPLNGYISGGLLIGSYFINFSVSAFVMDFGARKTFLKFFVLFSQALPIFLFLLLLSFTMQFDFEGTDPQPPTSTTEIILFFIGFIALTCFGAYFGMSNPIQKALLQARSKQANA